MILSEYYKHCLETWGQGNEDKRIVVGIEEEFGELAGKIKRYYRGDYEEGPCKNFYLDVSGEIGDCFYYLVMARERYQKAPDIDICNIRAKRSDVFTCWQNLNRKKYLILKKQDYDRMIKELCLFANGIGLDVDAILRLNIDKLRDRKNRGVIKGSGDGR